MFGIIEWQIVLQAWLILALAQLSLAPLLAMKWREQLFDAGWGWARALSWLCVSMVVWFVAHLGIPVNTQLGITFTFLWLVLGSMWLSRNYWAQFFVLLKKRWPIILLQELLFAAGFFGMVMVRAHNPDILDLEKFMDAGFMMAYTRSPTLPAMDMWLAGETINYYTFGHFMGSVLQRLWNIPLAYSYNLLLGVVAGLVAQHSFSFVTTLLAAVYPQKTGRRSIMAAGLIAALLVTVGGNSHLAWFYLKNQTTEGYWYPDATRFIENTIHEFPAYSFIVSDLHAHVWSLPFVLLTLGLFWLWVKRVAAIEHETWQEAAKLVTPPASFAGMMLGFFVMTNTWDFAIYGMFLAIVSVLLLVRSRRAFIPLIISAVTMGLTALIVATPWILSFESISEGVLRVTQTSPMSQLIALWGGHVLMTIGAVALSLPLLRKKPQESSAIAAVMVIALAATAIALLVLPELIFVKDIYPNHPRANTMFKLTFQAFVIMGLLGGWFFGFLQLRSAVSSFVRIVGSVVMSVLLVAFLAYPRTGFPSYYANWENPRGLDGLAWLKRDEPEAYAMIGWLGTKPGRPIIVEAVGESYTVNNRISAFTGLPTVVGWRVHEWLWRGGFEIPGDRSEEVRKIYEEPETAMAKQILKKYKVNYIIVAARERETYAAINELQLQSLGTKVFTSGAGYIIAVK